MESLKQAFEHMSPKARSVLAIGATVAVVGTVVGFAMNAATPEQRDRGSEKPVVESILTDQDPRSLGIDAISTQLRQIQADQRRLERTMGQKEKDQKLENTQTKVTSLEEELAMLRQEIARVERSKSVAPADDAVQPHGEAASVPASPIPERQVVQHATDSPNALSDVYSNLPPEPVIDPKARTSEKQEAPKIRVIRKEKPAEDKEAEKELSITLPAGSILSGVLVTGMDAPTGRQAQRDPFPSLLRIKSEAILPNRFRADFRECLLVAGGWGDLSSERAYMRAERLSCVRNDGTVLEATLEAYATGEDGKAGIRGRLVSKQGQILAKSMMAGFMQGVSSAFNVKQVPSINITRGVDSGEVQSPVYEQAMDSNALQGAAANGVGTAFEKIADYYLEMAESMFPVIEIDAMRDIDFIVTKGMTVKFNSTTLKVADVN